MIVVELAGLPATGKTSTARHLKALLDDRGVRASLVRESADILPLRSARGEWSFNAAVLAETVHRLVVSVNGTEKPEVVILDRGLYDLACWFDWLERRGKVSPERNRIFRDFISRIPWAPGREMLFQHCGSFEASLRRRKGRPGFVVNPKTFGELQDVYASAAGRLALLHPEKELYIVDSDRLRLDEVQRFVSDRVLAALSETATTASFG